MLTPEDEYELGRMVKEENDPGARDELVRSNLRLVVKIAKQYSSRKMSLDDLIEEGNLGLIRAVDYFDFNRGIRFSTYAAWWIKQSIKLALRKNGQPVHIPTYLVAQINQWRKMEVKVASVLGRPPEVEEMADIMQVSERKAKIIHAIVKSLGSVQDASGEDSDEGENLWSTLSGVNAGLPEDAIVESEEKAKALRLLPAIRLGVSMPLRALVVLLLR